MMLKKRYFIIMVCLFVMGIPARMFQADLPSWYTTYAGDALWACMVFFIFRLLLQKRSPTTIFYVTMIYTYITELSQLYKAPWIEHLRQTQPIGLILGYGFLYSDLLMYFLGIGTGYLLDKYFLGAKQVTSDGGS